jgi:hypothetical protein
MSLVGLELTWGQASWDVGSSCHLMLSIQIKLCEIGTDAAFSWVSGTLLTGIAFYKIQIFARSFLLFLEYRNIEYRIAKLEGVTKHENQIQGPNSLREFPSTFQMNTWRYISCDSATWYSTHICSTLLRFNCVSSVFINFFLLFMTPIHVWSSPTPAGVRCPHFTSVILWCYHNSGLENTKVKNRWTNVELNAT